MINKSLCLLLLILIGFPSIAQTIHYSLSMPKPQTHYFHVTVELTNFKDSEITMVLPVWAPGSYLVREFAQNINLVKATNEKNEDLPVHKTSKNEWNISRNNSSKVIVKYEYYAFELSVRTSFLDLSHGYLNGTNVFMYPKNYLNLGGRLTIYPHAGFSKVATALPKYAESVSSDGIFEFRFSNYDELGDCPIEIGNHEEFSFEAAGVNHHVAMYGIGNYNIPKLKEDMSRIIESATAVYGENPNKDYWFIIHNTTTGGGGLEHTNSTTLNVNRWSYDGNDYLGFLSLVAHEYFHLWNVKRIRPDVLWPYDYTKESYTDLLWVMEGFTSYYDELLLRRAGYYSENEYLAKVQSTLNYVESGIGNKVQPVAHASFDAWIKAYRPNENSSNTTVSYYPKGHLLALVLDAMIIKSNNGKKSLDDFMKLVYTKYYKELGRGISSDELRMELEKLTKSSLTTFFDKHINGVETIDYVGILKEIGVFVQMDQGEQIIFGISAQDEGGRLIIQRISAGSSAEQCGLSVNDEIISFNGFRVTKTTFTQYANGLNVGDEFNLIVNRDNQLMSLDCAMGVLPFSNYRMELEKGNKLTEYWLRTD